MKVQSFTIGPLETNAYLVVDERSRQALLIDPGLESEDIYDVMSAEGLTLTSIVNTHGHFDHVCGNAFFRAKTGAPVLIHREDAGIMQRAAEQARAFGFQVAPPPPPDRLLDEEDEVVMGGTRMRVLHTPGHTPGGICLYGEGVVFVGDALFASSIGRTDLPGGSYEVLLASIRTKLLSLPDDTVVYPGHGPPTTIGAERAHNPFLTGRGGMPLLLYDA
ncbi:MAG: MBL fold metallo-hydrolase [candidate division NC10 bacterium]|nr:MBL fold metallo-hydrolase [candidate division NC10 bacterium]